MTEDPSHRVGELIDWLIGLVAVLCSRGGMEARDGKMTSVGEYMCNVHAARLCCSWCPFGESVFVIG